MEVISEGYYIGSDDPSKTTRALDSYQSGIKKVDDRIANHPVLRGLANDDVDDVAGLNQARDLAHTKYEDDLTDAENTALDIGYDKIAKTTEEYDYEGFDTIADEFIDALSEFFDGNHDPEYGMEIYRRTNTIPEDLIVKLGLEDTSPRHLPVIIIATFESVSSSGRSMGPEDVYISVYPGGEYSGSSFELDGVNVQNFYHSYESYFQAKDYSGDVITQMVKDIGRAIYMDIGIF